MFGGCKLQKRQREEKETGNEQMIDELSEKMEGDG